ncbi:MAG TPA: methylmalonyl-CoA mutase, partial [Clostridia bacterium]|nr:methylmalonyl-CoA mutase [Clostridia bacterium]
TDTIEAKVWEYLDRIESMGGAVRAIEKGYLQKEIQTSSYQYQKAIESGEKTVIGINAYTDDGARPANLLRVDPQIGEQQIKRLQALRSRRDREKVSRSLMLLKEAAQDKVNLFPYILEAVRSYASIGEIIKVLKEHFGEYKQEISL